MTWMKQDGEIVPDIPPTASTVIGLARVPTSTKLLVHCNECRAELPEGSWACTACGHEPATGDRVLTSETDYDESGNQMGETRWFAGGERML